MSWRMWDEWSTPLDKIDLGRVSIDSIQLWMRDRSANIEVYKYKTAASAIGMNHAFQDIPWHKLGTHSMKKAVVTLMAEAAVSWSYDQAVKARHPSVRLMG